MAHSVYNQNEDYKSPINTVKMKNTKVQNPQRILHILRPMPMCVHRACVGLGQNYTHAHYL